MQTYNTSPISVGDIIESDLLAFEMDVRDAHAKNCENEYWCFEQGVGFYDFENEGCPWSLWVVIVQKDDMFLIVPWTGDDESKLVNNDHPDHFFLPMPVKVQYEWDEWWLEMKHISYNTPLELPPGEIYALAGFSQWRSAEELNFLRREKMRHLLPGEADKIRRVISRMVRN
jgi:hypothetical protein